MGMSAYSDKSRWTKQAFLADVLDWAQSDPGDAGGAGRVPEKEAGWMRAMGAAALRHDGKSARRYGNMLRKSWTTPSGSETR